jgi:DNA-binding beta-propeller fold protein YncE
VYVASGAAHAILILNETSGSQLGTIAVPNSGGPTALAFDPASGRLYAGVDAGVDVFDTKNSNNLVGTIATISDPFSMALNPSNGRLYVSSYGYAGPAQVAALNTSNLTQINVLTLPDSSGGLTVNPSTGYVYASLFNTSGLAVIASDASSILKTVTVGPNPWGVCVDSQRNRVYVADYNYSQTNPQPGSVSEIDGSSNSIITTVTVGKGATAIMVDETADKVYVANAKDSSVSVLNGN